MDGQDNNKRYTTEILADVMNLLGRRSDNPSSDGQQGYESQQGYGSQQSSAGQSAGGYQQPAAPKPAPAPSIPADDPDDLPF